MSNSKAFVKSYDLRPRKRRASVASPPRVLNTVQAHPPNRLLFETLNLFSRHELFDISFANRRFRDFIDRNYTERPYLILNELYFEARRQLWAINDMIFPPDVEKRVKKYLCPRDILDVVDQLWPWNFLRFSYVYFDFTSYRSVMDVLGPLSHIWKGGVLDVVWDSFVPTEEFAQLVSTACCLTLDGRRILQFLSAIKRNGSQKIQIDDLSSAPTTVKIEDIIDFLFGSTLPDHRELTISVTKVNPMLLIQVARQRFSAATAKLSFTLRWVHRGSNQTSPLPLYVFYDHNETIDQGLEFFPLPNFSELTIK
ncbi:hypothetical protein DdX_04507 [Ditylenchus destructor]|uniref:Uncharacterized protein n=1 Tax=Ditylenchus destructor TaxID=166010 RepID=A0AAD4N9Z2_9BILA|nr:hypothetical protein DdX_04507 [Ditylenchus destructor]